MKQKTSLDDVEKDIRLAWDIVESINARRLLERQEEEIPDDLPLYSEVELKEVRDRVSKNLPRIIQTLQAPDPTPALKIIEMLTMTEDFVDTAVILLGNALPSLIKLLRGESCESVLKLLHQAYFTWKAMFTEIDVPVTPTDKIRRAVFSELPFIKEYILSHPESPAHITRKKRWTVLENLLYMFETRIPWVEKELAAIMARAMNEGKLRSDTKMTLRSMIKDDDPMRLPFYQIETALGNFTEEVSEDILKNVFAAFGLPFVAYVDDLGLTFLADAFADQIDPQLYILRECAAIQELVQRDGPEAPRLLYENYGIRWFSRYDTHVLSRRVREHGDASRPFGIAVIALHDSNSAFFEEHFHTMMHQFDDRLSALGIGLRIFEVGSPEELRHRLDWLHVFCSEENKIMFQLLTAHSGKTHIELGRGKDGDIEATDLQRGGILYVPRYFTENAVGIFDGCSSGLKGGIGGKAEIFSRVITSKSVQSALTELIPIKDSRGLSFDSTYVISQGDDSITTKGREFHRGRSK